MLCFVDYYYLFLIICSRVNFRKHIFIVYFFPRFMKKDNTDDLSSVYINWFRHNLSVLNEVQNNRNDNSTKHKNDFFNPSLYHYKSLYVIHCY